MAFTANEIASVANASTDFYFNRGETFKQSVQQRPLLSIMEGAKKTFPGGKGNLRKPPPACRMATPGVGSVLQAAESTIAS